MSALLKRNARGPVDRTQVTGHEVRFDDAVLIVSKTDTKGIITYANRAFMDISGYLESEVIGKPHALIRHPHMPRTVFNLLWSTIKSGNEIFAYVMNRCRNGDHYWVLAHVTPTFAVDGTVTGYHSNRRNPRRAALDKVIPLYERMRQAENAASGPAEALAAGTAVLSSVLETEGVDYARFVLSL